MRMSWSALPLVLALSGTGPGERAGPLPFGLSLGMAEGEVHKVLRRADPGAYRGALCGAGHGVMAFAPHAGTGWQVMARTEGGPLGELRLHRATRKGIENREACAAAFDRAVSDLGIAARPASIGADEPGLLRRLRTEGPGWHALLEARRRVGDRALCQLDIAYAATPPDRAVIQQ